MDSKQIRTIPLLILRAISNFKEVSSGKFPGTIEPGYQYMIRDTNEGSDFFFGIVEAEVKQNGNIEFSINQKPTGPSIPDMVSYKIPVNELEANFNGWLDCAAEYATHAENFVQREPIADKQEFADFTILETDDDKYSTIPMLLLIDAYLSDCVKQLNSYKDENELEPDQLQIVEELIEDAQEIRETQTQHTQSHVARKLSALKDKATKAGITIFNEFRKVALTEIIRYFLKEGATNHELMSNAIKGLIEKGSSLL